MHLHFYKIFQKENGSVKTALENVQKGYEILFEVAFLFSIHLRYKSNIILDQLKKFGHGSKSKFSSEKSFLVLSRIILTRSGQNNAWNIYKNI